METGIYGIYNSVDDKWYVGQSQNLERRLRDHKYMLRNHKSGENQHLQRAWDIRGESAFEFRILEYCSVHELNDREVEWIGRLDAYRCGYNQTLGGKGHKGYLTPDGTRNVRAQRMKELWANSEYRAKMSIAYSEAQNREETRIKQSERMKELWKNPEHRNAVLPKLIQATTTPEAKARRSQLSKEMWSDPVFSELTREKINNSLRTEQFRKAQSERIKLRYQDEEFREKFSESIRKSWENEEHRLSRSAGIRKKWQDEAYRERILGVLAETHDAQKVPVLNVETGEVFESIAAASLHYKDANRRHISSCCSAERVTAGGFHWRYADETEEEWINKRLQVISESIADNNKKRTRRIVRCVETGEIFLSITEAAQAKNISRDHIGEVCRGERKTAAGFHWQYVKEGEL